MRSPLPSSTSTDAELNAERLKWARGQAYKLHPAKRAINGFFRLVLRSGAGLRDLSVGEFGLLLTRIALWASLVLFPIWIQYLTDDSFPGDMAAGCSVILLILTAGSKLSHHYADAPSREENEHRADVAIRLGNVFSEISLRLRVLKSQKEGLPDIQKLVKQVLNCIFDEARIFVKDFGGSSLEVTLITFESDGADAYAKVYERATDSRTAGCSSKAADSMAWYIARVGKFRTVHNFGRETIPFPYRRLTAAGDPWYRSILLMPIVDNDKAYGVVTIDSNQPYLFWPHSAEDYVNKVTCHLSILKLLLSNNVLEVDVE